jgi:anthranilate/para-aminobenzoate synthase component I
VHHRKARLSGFCRAEVGREEVLEALVPSGSVTGAPKVRAMEVIADLERHRRGLYTGALGYVAHDGGVTLAMAIRVLVLDAVEGAGWAGHYWSGGGIVADSDPAAELRETGWKALQLFAAAR